MPWLPAFKLRKGDTIETLTGPPMTATALHRKGPVVSIVTSGGSITTLPGSQVVLVLSRLPRPTHSHLPHPDFPGYTLCNREIAHHGKTLKLETLPSCPTCWWRR